ncbi:ectonucleoside triphosphate diphosphohydrolase 1-like [Ruditapes philippinarum]|uniref:ectonucleoside triphosphate diphosphohydrolase 1-like n=1 Tax=Ruditapes philippinarum TaxID=129788 RepID=UPI00295B087E|nr:ectonucleoside triphosphate diphosphohydrolase 1-like [Ruditapes philippinarum]
MIGKMDDILVEVVCRIPGHESKTFSVATSERNTIAGVIRKVCKENGIAMKTSYTLLDNRERVLQWSQTLIHCGIKHNDILYLTNEDEDVHVHNGCFWNSWWFVAAISLLIGGVGVTAITILYTKNGETQYQYGVVLDAGSSHTKLFIYKWDGEKLHETAEAKQVHYCTVIDHGITSYVNTPSNLSGPLSVCLEEAKQHIPYDNREDTPIFLGATAGMRMLNEVNAVKSATIIHYVQDTIKKFPFKFTSPTDQARIITGQEEGTFGWVTANYISGKLGVVPEFSMYRELARPEATMGALDLGGASTQIKIYVLLLQNQGYNETNITNPCGPSGYTFEILSRDIFEAPCVNRYTNEFLQIYQLSNTLDATNFTFIGTGDEEECRAIVKSLYNFSAPCPMEPCTFNGTYQPPIQGDFYAFSSFFYEMDFLKLTNKKASLKKFTTELTILCNKSWEEVSHLPAGKNGSMLGWYCFEGHFIRTLLVDAYKFNDDTWENIHFVQKINGTDIGWTLGYMLNSSNAIPIVGPERFISTTAFSSLTVLFAIFVLLSVAFACYARKHQQQKTLGLYERVPTYGAV